MVGLNPEFAHETMSGLSFHHAVAQTLWHGKLFHIDLNAQRIGKFDQDFRFGSEGIRDAFYLVKLLEDSRVGRHAPLRRARVPHRGRRRACGTSPAGCMRTLPDPHATRPRASAPTREIQAALAGGAGRAAAPSRRCPTASADALAALRARAVRRRARSPRRATATSGSTSSSPSCSSACADHGRAARRSGSTRRPSPRKVEVRDADTGRARGVGPGAASADARRRAASRTRRRGGTAFEAAWRSGRCSPTSAAMAVAGQQHGMVVLDAAGDRAAPGQAVERHRVGARRGLARRPAA